MTATEQAQVEARIDGLRGDAEILRHRLASAPTSGDSSADVSAEGRLSAAAAAMSKSLAERTDAVRSTLELQRQAAAATAEHESLTQTRTALEDRIARAAGKVSAAKAEAAALAEAALQLERPPGATNVEQTVSLPSLRPSSKTEVCLYVRFDKLFITHTWRDGQRLGPNTEQFVVTQLPADEGGQQVARPKPNAGLVVDPTTIAGDLRRLLAPFPPRLFVVGLIVFEDSFDVFQLIKAEIVKAGYEYRPLALKPGESVVDFGGNGEAQ